MTAPRWTLARLAALERVAALDTPEGQDADAAYALMDACRWPGAWPSVARVDAMAASLSSDRLCDAVRAARRWHARLRRLRASALFVHGYVAANVPQLADRPTGSRQPLIEAKQIRRLLEAELDRRITEGAARLRKLRAVAREKE